MNQTTGSVLDLLRRARGHLSGEAIGRDLGISRSAVSKHIAALRGSGYDIESTTRRGHRLLSGIDTPTPEEVTPMLTTAAIGRQIRFLDTVDSTNTAAAHEAAAGAPEGTVIVADSQTAGRGRQHREWLSPAGCNLYFSIVLRPRVPPRRIPQISLVAAAAVHRAVSPLLSGLRIKWPNDILTAGGLKICGILCESELETDAVHHAIVGIGLNVNTRRFPPALRKTASSLRLETGVATPRPRVLASVLNSFEEAYLAWQAARDLTPLLPYIEKFSALDGRAMEVRGLTETTSGRAEGLTPEGELLVRTASGNVQPVSCGDAHITKPPHVDTIEDRKGSKHAPRSN